MVEDPAGHSEVRVLQARDCRRRDLPVHVLRADHDLPAVLEAHLDHADSLGDRRPVPDSVEARSHRILRSHRIPVDRSSVAQSSPGQIPVGQNLEGQNFEAQNCRVQNSVVQILVGHGIVVLPIVPVPQTLVGPLCDPVRCPVVLGTIDLARTTPEILLVLEIPQVLVLQVLGSCRHEIQVEVLARPSVDLAARAAPDVAGPVQRLRDDLLVENSHCDQNRVVPEVPEMPCDLPDDRIAHRHFVCCVRHVLGKIHEPSEDAGPVTDDRPMLDARFVRRGVRQNAGQNDSRSVLRVAPDGDALRNLDEQRRVRHDLREVPDAMLHLVGIPDVPEPVHHDLRRPDGLRRGCSHPGYSRHGRSRPDDRCPDDRCPDEQQSAACGVPVEDHCAAAVQVRFLVADPSAEDADRPVALDVRHSNGLQIPDVGLPFVVPADLRFGHRCLVLLHVARPHHLLDDGDRSRVLRLVALHHEADRRDARPADHRSVVLHRASRIDAHRDHHLGEALPGRPAHTKQKRARLPADQPMCLRRVTRIVPAEEQRGPALMGQKWNS